MQESIITPELIQKLEKLNAFALEREQTLAQMALAWLLKDSRVTSVLISQLLDSLECLKDENFYEEDF